MRENKFRAWDKINKRWIYCTLHPTHIGWSAPDYTAQSLLYSPDDYAEGIGFAAIEGWLQYSSLKDKNGKEIYEGDIIQQPLSSIDHYCSETGRAIFSDPILCRTFVEFRDGYFGYHEMRFGGLMGAKDNNAEIIGNIYENPELLK